jgi:hypothetical protein
LDAEVLIDAINQVTGTSDLYTSAIPEPYTFIPEQAGDRPARRQHHEPVPRAVRPAGPRHGHGERTHQPADPLPVDALLNSSHIQSKLEKSPVLAALASPKRPPQDIVDDLYVLILSRPPSRTERSAIETYTKSGIAKGRELWTDLAWALINSDEFLYRH